MRHAAMIAPTARAVSPFLTAVQLEPLDEPIRQDSCPRCETKRFRTRLTSLSALRIVNNQIHYLDLASRSAILENDQGLIFDDQ